MKVDPSNYDYIMYVDASGDDGFRFDKDSSTCYAAAALLVKQQDVQHNLDILNQIKSIVGCKETDEIKYSRIRRHRRGADALSLLRDVKGSVSSFIIFKKELSPTEIPKGTKALSVVCHLMALRSLDFYTFLDNEKILIVIDRMKHTEEVPLEQQLESGVLSDQKHPERNFSFDTIFRDSKDANFLLIQLADLLCGTFREHFEQYETNEDMLYFKNVCPKCKNIIFMKPKNSHPMCKKGRSRVSRIYHSKNLHNIIDLIPVSDTRSILEYFFMKPAKMMNQHFYLVCPKLKK